VIVSGYVPFYQINKFFINILFYHPDKMFSRPDGMASRAEFGLWAMIWRPWSRFYMTLAGFAGGLA